MLSRAMSKASVRATAAVLGLGVGGLATSAVCSDEVAHPPEYEWSHNSWFSTFDHAAVKRGYQVYKQVCSSCHSMNRLSFRNLVDVIYTEDEAKEIAAEYMVSDGPNDEGEMFERPGKLFDYFPAPYPNEQAARLANNGAYPPDLSLMAKARHSGQDYVFALLTGYTEDPPAGVKISDDQYYNPHFAGGAIGMAPPLYDGAVEYEDGTPNTLSQMAKDVTTFLAWAAEPEHDDRKKMGVKFVLGLTIATAFAGFYKRFRWSTLKTRSVAFKQWK